MLGSPMSLGKSMMIDLIRHKLTITMPCRSPDGQCLFLSSADGYCSIVIFDLGELGTVHPTQQHHRQLQAIAHSHNNGISTPSHHHLLIVTLSIRHIPNRVLPPQVTVLQSVMWPDKAQHLGWQGVIEKVQQPVAWLVLAGQFLRLYCQFPMLEVVPKRLQARRAL